MEQLELSYAAGRMERLLSHWKIVWQFVIKLNVTSLYDPAILSLGIYKREVKNLCS